MDSVPTLECRAAKRITRTAHRNLRCEGGNLHRARKCCAVKGGNLHRVWKCCAVKGKPASGAEVLRCEGGNLHRVWKCCVVKGITCTGWKKVRHGMETLVLRGRDCVGRDLDFQLPLFSCSVSQGLKEFSDVGSGSGRER